MEEKKSKRNWITAICLVLIFSFFSGYYLSYRINENEKSKLEIIQEIMEEEWYYGIDDENIKQTLETRMILGMLDMEKDPFTRYLTSLGTLADTYTGIGIGVTIYGKYFIVDEVSSKSAIEDGIKVGDVIISINETSVENKTLEELNEIIGTSENIALKIVRNNDFNNPLTIYTKVTTYDPITVFTKEYNNGISYVKITEFNLDTSELLDSYFSTLTGEYSNLVLDLRGNPGGYISAVRDVLDLFVPDNKIAMTTVDKNGRTTYVKTQNSDFYIFNEIVILIDGNSASGAEALSAAMNYHLGDVVTLYGDTTYGKGSAQKTYYFSDGTYFHYTYALWNTPAGNTINHIGVSPEIVSINEGISSLTLYTSELELYSYGEEVLSLQKLLKMLNYYSGPLHSFMDEELANCLKKFQEDNSLTISGKVDNETLRYISKLMYDDKQNYLNTELETVIGSMFS